MPDDKVGSVSSSEDEDGLDSSEILFKYMLELKRNQIKRIYEPNMRK